MKFRACGVFILALVATAGCAPQIQSARLVDGIFQPINDEVRVYSTVRPECPYQEIALITGTRRNSWNNLDDVLSAMRVRARALGGDAIVALGSGPEVSGIPGSDGIVS